ncbi:MULTISPECIES: HD-GYP domain-containing protein [Paenibacillus]|uniref:HD-GYP domain-containing protein (C-di-GMP phosphodiesterase class II) n=1 Tax=Paenibacillus pabuli TaxID=1472 RepID=A0A855YDS7_9BACL|nr:MULTISPECIES: HD-GYP domain-containing protein [Paenibacillus]PWW41046.1 HD-GYP domain-containing protein (c-di-GMP phosphodiesterase class II) [Paenibacillus pabuli]PXW12170.1 HD-GYP domain-containing protein (c-di-GMP phosphodiesterase class II) [Paenibacillus taichungensis]RAI97114.1 HD-GYP domain-containing protein (c-di-GMP phosphodiesterase class II) [Paenibacillus pabuli]
MRLVHINLLQPGMKLGKRIYSEEGLVLLSEGVELTSRLIGRLKDLGIGYVYISDAATEDIIIPDMLQEETRRRALVEIKQQFQSMSGLKTKSRIPHFGKALSGIMNTILEDIGSQKEAMIMLMDMNASDFDLYNHSLNVCVYTLVLGVASGYTRQQLMEIGLGALLHDIGKTQIAPEILHKPAKLSDEEFKIIQQHTTYGHRILKDEPGIPLLAAHCALQHHERIDGSGYPFGLKDKEIHEYAKWLALADSYDAMTTNRVYKQGLLPHQAVEVLYTGSGTLYEQRMLEKFRDCVAIYPLGISVTLSTGEIGVVAEIHPRVPQRPRIRVLKDAYGQTLSAPYEIDLSTALSVMITGVEGVEDATPASARGELF